MRKKKEKILIVEDEQAILSLLSDILSHRGGYPVITSQSGEEALRIYRNQHSEIALVILDMNLPGMSGQEVFHEMKRINPNVSAVISTGYGKGEKIDQMYSEGIKGFMQKPFVVKELLKLVENIIGAR